MPSSKPFATMAWRYPGDDVLALKVGAGNHEGDPSNFTHLMRKNDWTRSDTDEGGYFDTLECALDHRDSGGPIYVNKQVVGIAHACRASDGRSRARYTSIPPRLDWILDAIDYEWPGNMLQFGRRTGTAIETFYATTRVCEYACDRTATCVAFNSFKDTGVCQTLSTIAGWQSTFSVVTGLKAN